MPTTARDAFEDWWDENAEADVIPTTARAAFAAGWNAALQAVWGTVVDHNQALEDNIDALYTVDVFDPPET